MPENHDFSNPVDPHDAGPTTGWHQSLASTGKHGEYSSFKWAARRNQQPGPVPLQRVESPLTPTASFVSGYIAAEQQKSHIVGKLVGGVIGYAAAKAYVSRSRWAK